MYIIYYILLPTVSFIMPIYCQGAGGSIDEIARGSVGGTGLLCTIGNCGQGIDIIVLCTIGGIAGFLLIIFGTIFYCRHGKSRAIRNNPSFVNMGTGRSFKQEISDISPFQSGIWSSRYFQHERWHGPHRFSLSFDTQSMTVTGSGVDDVGTFTIDGIYSNKTTRIGLTKTYQLGTGNPSENFGHHVTFQLTWNVQNRQFEGKWYVKTNKYQGEDKFEMKFEAEE